MSGTYNSASVNYNLSNGSASFQFNQSNTITQAVLLSAGGTVSIPTSATTLNVTGVTTQGLLFVVNCDTVNFIELGITVSSTFYPVMRLKAGEGYVVRLDPGVTLQAKADTAAVVLQYMVQND